VRPSTTARRYAEAAFDVAQADGNVDVWLQDLGAVEEALRRPVVSAFFEDPNVGRDERLQTLPMLFPNAPQHVLNLLRLLATRHRMHLVPSVVREFEALVHEARGVLEASVTVARPIDEAERTEIAQRLGQATGKTVEVQTHVDPSIIGGVVIRVGDQLIDASISGRLQRLRQQLAV
jgi:F-type H+-transporting ATPase subunit delta